jgi:hypothetical protein
VARMTSDDFMTNSFRLGSPRASIAAVKPRQSAGKDGRR